MVGTHAHSRAATQRRQNTANVNFSNQRQRTRARSGEVNTITPRTRTRETNAAYSRRMSSGRQVEDLPKRRFARGVVIVVIIVAVVLALAIAAGMAAYSASVNSGHALRDSDASTALTKVSTPQSTPYYVLVAVELGAVSTPLSNEGPDYIELIRVDESAGKVTLINVPANLKVSVSSTESARIADVAKNGDAAFISAVSSYFGESIAHYVKLTQQDFVSLVDTLNGVDLTLSEEVDDPRAGNRYLPAGETTLSGEDALVFLRATNFADGADQRMVNQNNFTAALLEKLFSSNSISFASKLDSVNGYIQTDMSTDDILGIQSRVGSVSAADMVCATLSGYTDTPDSLLEGTTYYVASSSSTSSLMAQIDKDGTVPATQTTQVTVNPADVKVEVQNGAGISGAASYTANLLASQGFVIEEQGNADQQVYTETLVVYDKDEAKAQAVADALGFGRVVYGQGYYEYETDVLVVIGSDYKPTS